MRARRIVSVRETASGEKHKMRAEIYKKICDPFSKIVARPCFGTVNIVYSPQHLMLFCSNHPIQMDVNDEAVTARTAIIDHTAIFVDNPVESNHSKRLDLSRDVLVAKYRVGTFWLLQRVYRQLLHGRSDRNIRPVPEQSGESVALDCQTEVHIWWPKLLARMESAPPRHATPAAEIEASLVGLGVDVKDAKLRLQERGLERKRRLVGMVNTWLYVYMFPTSEGRREGFVKLR
jgi:hypothetical protein